MVFQSGVVLPKSRYNRLLIEAEVAFVLKSDIFDATLERVAAAIDYVTPAFEVVDFRYDGSVGQIVDTIADNAGCSGIVVGEEKHPYGSVDLKAVEMVITGAARRLLAASEAMYLATRSTPCSGWPTQPSAQGSRCELARCCSRVRSATSSLGRWMSSVLPPLQVSAVWSRVSIPRHEFRERATP